MIYDNKKERKIEKFLYVFERMGDFYFSTLSEFTIFTTRTIENIINNILQSKSLFHGYFERRLSFLAMNINTHIHTYIAKKKEKR